MSDYPEHAKMAEVAERTQVIGEFLEWLAGEGVQLMLWRDDLTDVRVTDPVCPVRRRPALEDLRLGELVKLPCDPTRDDGPTENLPYYMGHCKHWQHPGDVIAGGQPGTCCRCSRGTEHEVTGLKSFVHDGRGTERLLADWAGIDLRKIDAEKRQMLNAIRTANAATEA